MFKKHLLLLLLLALMAPWAANAQTRSTLTVYENETGQNRTTPIYNYYFDAYSRAQTVFPKEDLADMTCGTITSIRFYTTMTYDYETNVDVDVYLTEVDSKTISSFVALSDATIVYTGHLEYVKNANNGNKAEVLITLATPYQYGGGNLLFGCDNQTKGDYESIYYLGKTSTGSSIYGNNSSATPTTASAGNFLPKTTFTYTPSPYAIPATIAYTNNAPGNTTVNWTAPNTTETVTGYAYRYKKTSVSDWPAFESLPASTLSVTLSLDYGTAYDFEVKTLYGENESCVAKKVSFTTLDNCMTPENLTITDVTWNSATFNWTEGFGNGQWKLGYKKSSETTYTLVDVVAADLPITLDVFEGETEYDVVVYPLCDNTKTLEDSFTTPCGPQTPVDWTENFNSYTTGIASSTTAPTGYPDVTLPDCWQFLNRSTSSSVYPQAFLSSSTTYAVSGNCLFFKSSSTTPLYAILPQFTEAINTLQLCFTYRNEGVSDYNGTLIVGYMTNPTDATTFHPVYTCAQTTTKTPMEVPFPSEASGYMVFKYQGGSSSNYYLGIDNVSVEPIPTCGRPGTPMVAPNTLTNHSATLTWTSPEGQDAWQIAYSKTSFDPNVTNFDLTTVNVIDVTSKPYTFDKTLDAASTYYMYVRGNCGSDGYSKWCKTACSFTTGAAAPKPTAVTVTNIGSTTADLYWTKGGGDFETSWDVYRVASETAPDAPTAATTPTFTVNTLPTAAAPYEMSDLTAETKYYLWVRANHGNDGYSDWQAMSGSGYFTTQVACPKPTNVAAVPSHTSANITWTGYSDSYTVEKRIAASMGDVLLSESFDGDDMPTGWEITGSGTDNWSIEESNYAGGEENELLLYYSPSFTGTSRVVLPEFNLTGIASVSVSFKHYLDYYGGYGSQTIGIATSSDGGETWHSGWSKSYSADASGTIEEVITTDDMNNEHVLICLYYTGDVYGVDGWYFDDFQIGEVQPEGPWQVVTENATNGAYNIEGLTMNTKYDVRVTPNCGGVASDICTFTTYGDNTKIFKTEGNWNVADNWDGGIPAASNNAIIRANATIPAEYDAVANHVTIEGTPAPTITIKDGGQLHSDNTVVATVEKDIIGYTGDKDHYYLISAPFRASTTTSSVVGLLDGTFDFYAFDGTQDLEWRNHQVTAINSMANGKGYLYAKAATATAPTTTLKFTGTVAAQLSNLAYINGGSALTYNTTAPLGTFNLVGNSLPHNGYVYIGTVSDGYVTFANTSYYKMNTAGDEIEPSDEEVKPCEGIFVQSSASSQYAFVSSESHSRSTGLNLALTQGNSLVDRALIRFGEGNNLDKFQLNPSHTKIYMPVEGKDCAAVYTEESGEMPVCFKASENGTYTLSFAEKNVEFSYLHLIDNMTGADVDLLATPSYSFEARTTDYASRFKLVFATGNNADGNFAFFSNGSFVINNEGNATLQVIDVTGRVIKSESINGCANVSVNAATGVYMLRLINGNDVKVQKVVVR